MFNRTVTQYKIDLIISGGTSDLFEELYCTSLSLSLPFVAPELILDVGSTRVITFACATRALRVNEKT